MKQKYPPLLMNSELVKNLESIRSAGVQGEEARKMLGVLLQSALKLEFATVPPYLSAAFSLSNDNQEIKDLIVRISKEEMLHMTVVANLMNAIGIAPDIVKAVPNYPYDLDVLDPPLRLDLSSFSFELVENLFMQIETPEEPVTFLTRGVPSEDVTKPETIGQFYERVIELINEDTIPDLFKNAERDIYKQIQVSPNFKRVAYSGNTDEQEYHLEEALNFIITDKKSAVRHLNWIIGQGEGATPFDPLTAEGIPGHYYRFESILKSKYLIKDDAVPDLGYSYSGGDLPFSTAGVNEFETNAKAENYTAHPGVERSMLRFNKEYSKMVDYLQLAFNCPGPEQKEEAGAAYKASLQIMRKMDGRAGKIIRAAARVEGGDVKAGIPFQYTPTPEQPADQ
uniref:Iminophenyl-pyruvate dimer synthase domain-containing protein n=1 Tax=uncultured Thiotrichaceae bacterium TaxID=298394 RepID=A0A6S6UF88_9GAMM|nr:MAG: Unknown protein [uncultured Thiotrichaceae bacterium]